MTEWISDEDLAQKMIMKRYFNLNQMHEKQIHAFKGRLILSQKTNLLKWSML